VAIKAHGGHAAALGQRTHVQGCEAPLGHELGCGVDDILTGETADS
jgi:hypothetical protein